MSAATVLSCAMAMTGPTPAALANTNIVMNINLTEATAASMASGEAPALFPRIIGAAKDARGWVVHNALDPNAPQLMIGHVTATPGRPKPLAMRWGLATRAGDAFTFQEKMHGACRLAAPEELK